MIPHPASATSANIFTKTTKPSWSFPERGEHLLFVESARERYDALGAAAVEQLAMSEQRRLIDFENGTWHSVEGTDHFDG